MVNPATNLLDYGTVLFYYLLCITFVSYIPLYLLFPECPRIFISRDACFIIALGTI